MKGETLSGRIKDCDVTMFCIYRKTKFANLSLFMEYGMKLMSKMIQEHDNQIIQRSNEGEKKCLIIKTFCL